jgi:glycosyltransferase involved in cell wall biosynthesis
MAGWLIAAADLVTTGGMDIANLHLARHFAAHGGVELVTHRVDEALAKTPGVSITPVPRPLGMNVLGEPLLRRMAKKRSRAQLAAGGRVVGNGGNCPNPDVNWVHYVHAAYTPIFNGSWLRRRKIAYYHRKCLKQEREAFHAARLVICNSHLTARQVIALCGVDARKTRVVYYGGDPESLGPVSATERTLMRRRLGWADDRPVAVFVGALGDRRKGFDTLFTAWQVLCQHADWDVDLAVIGRGAELAAWQQHTAEAGLAERIHYLGFRSDVPKVLAACDVMVHPVRYEAYGLGVHEAVCRGLPAIVSADAGVSELLKDSLNEILLPDPTNANDLQARLKHWRLNLEIYNTVTADLAAKLRARTWDAMAQEFRTVAESA